MTARALPVYAPDDTIRCAPLRATMPARQCVALSTRTERRPLGCLGCAQGAAVREALGDLPRARPVDRRQLLTAVAFGASARARQTSHAGSSARVAARHRDRTPANADETAEAKRLLAAIYSRHATKGAAEKALGLGRATILALGDGQCTRGTLAVLRNAAGKPGVRHG